MCILRPYLGAVTFLYQSPSCSPQSDLFDSDHSSRSPGLNPQAFYLRSHLRTRSNNTQSHRVTFTMSTNYQIPQMISFTAYHYQSSSSPISPSLPSSERFSYGRPDSRTADSSSSTATVNSSRSRDASLLSPRSSSTKPRSSFDPLALPSFIPAEFAPRRQINSRSAAPTSNPTQRPRSSSHNGPDDYSFSPMSRAVSQPPTTSSMPPSRPRSLRSDHGYSAMTSGFASLASSRKGSPVLGPMEDRLSEEVKEEMKLFRD